MNKDMTVPCEDGLINLRVGAIIMKNKKILMVGNNVRPEYLYSVGGRIKFGETSQEAVVREVFEETGVKLEVDRLGFIHENYFYGDAATNLGKLIYEVSYYYYMKVPDDFEPVCMSMTEDDSEEFLRWIDIDDPIKYYPEFFRKELIHPIDGVKHFVTDERAGKTQEQRR
jgi:8-oxo-dGTP pyrophosphatase MutT (NUDIX family)